MSAKPAVRDRPILFTGPMVRAILAGQKTQTRRVVTPPPSRTTSVGGLAWDAPDGGLRHCGGGGRLLIDNTADLRGVRSCCRYGVPGDRLWVRETWRENDPPSGYVYRADVHAALLALEERPWRPSIFMPRAACRIRLEITDVRVERVQGISEADALAEGIQQEDLPRDPDNFHPPGSYGFVSGLHPFPKGLIHVTPRDAYQELWDAINRDRGFGWDVNPWVWAITFRRAS